MHTCILTQKSTTLNTHYQYLCIHQNEQVQHIPLGPLQRIIALHNVTIDSRSLGTLQEKGISLVCINSRHVSRCVQLIGPQYQSAKRRMAQYHWFQQPNVRLDLAKALLLQRNQQQQAQLTNWPAKHRYIAQTSIRKLTNGMATIEQCANSQTLLGIEGSQAKFWFQAVGKRLPTSWSFTKRIRRPPPDPFNALLSLSYTLAYSEAVRLCIRHGLDPWLGFWHQPCHGRYSLACDILEPVRCQIDVWLLGLVHTQILRGQDFSRGESGCRLKKAGQKRFYQAWSQYLPELSHALQTHVYCIAKWLHDRPQACTFNEEGYGP